MEQVANILAGTILWGWSCVVFSLGLFKILAAATGVREDSVEAKKASQVDVPPPTPAEAASAAAEIEQAKASVKRMTGRHCVSTGQWQFAILVLALVISPWVIFTEEYWRFGAGFSALVFVFYVPWLASKDLRRFRKYQRLRNGQVLVGILQCISAEYSPGGEGPDYKVWLVCSFRTPTGDVVTERFSRLALPDNCEGNYRWPGPPAVPPFFAGFPSLGERRPVNILYVDDSFYEIIGWRGAVLGG